MYFHNIKDRRGAHIKYFCDNPDYKIDEVYSTVSNYGTIRGFHKSLTQDKYIQCISGSAYIILVDEENNKIIKEKTSKKIVFCFCLFHYFSSSSQVYLN